MKTILFLLVMYKGDVRYMASLYPTQVQCQSELNDAISEFKANAEIQIIRAECIQAGRLT